MSNYKNNFDACKFVNKNFELKVNPPEDFSVVKTEGLKNFTIGKGKNYIQAYPTKDAKKQIEEVVSKLDTENDTCSIIVGIGTGHLVHGLLEKKNKQHTVVVIEPCDFIMEEAFKNYDFSKWIKNGTMAIIREVEDMKYMLHSLNEMFVINNWSVTIDQYSLHMPQYTKLINETSDTVNSIRCNVGTVMGAGPVIAKNDIENFPFIFFHRGVKELEGIFKEKPAILVNTGPSLEKNIHLLMTSQHHFVIIAVAQALRILLAYGIRPDFITSVDYGEVNKEHFDGTIMYEDVPLVCINRTYHKILREYKGPKVIVSSQDIIDESFTKLLVDKGGLLQGGSVSHMSLGLALHLGCDRIAIIGQDLALTDGKSHNQNADASGKVKEIEGHLVWEVDDPSSLLSKDEGKHSMGYAVDVEGYFGEKVTTNVGLASFINNFKNMIATFPEHITVYNCTEGGADIPNTKKCSLYNFIEENTESIETLNKGVIQKYIGEVTNPEEKAKEALDVFEKDLKNLNLLIEHSESGIKDSKRMLELLDEEIYDSGKMRFLLKKNEKSSSAAQNIAKMNNVIGVAIYKASRRIHSRDMTVDMTDKTPLEQRKEDLRIRLNRNIYILEEAIKAVEELKPSYEITIKLLGEYVSSGDKSLLIEKLPRFESLPVETYEAYFQKGNWARPLLDCILADHMNFPYMKDVGYKASILKSEAIQEAIRLYDPAEVDKTLEYNRLVKKGREYGTGTKGEKDYDKAITLLRNAYDLKPEEEKAIWGLGSCYFFTKEYEKSIECYDELIKLAPKNLKYKFERGQVLLKIDLPKGLDAITKVMEESEEFDFFFYQIALIYIEIDMPEFAIDAFKQYRKKYPFNQKANQLMIECYKKIGKEEEAKELEKELC